MYYELNKMGIRVERQILLPISYERLYIPKAYKIDLLVENKLALELKSIFPLPPVYFNQVRTQLSLLNLKNGMFLNFKVNLMKEGIFRVFNNFGADEFINDKNQKIQSKIKPKKTTCPGKFQALSGISK